MNTDIISRINFEQLPDVCDINDLDALLPLSRSSIYRGARNGEIPCRNVGKRVIFSKADLIRRFGGQTAESIGNAFS